MATFRKVRELLLTSFEDGDMSPFVKHVAINNNSLFFFVATVDIAMPSPCSASSYAISVNLGQGIPVAYLRKKTRSDQVTHNALAARNNEAYGQGNCRQSFCTVLQYWTRAFLVLAVYKLARARNVLSV